MTRKETIAAWVVAGVFCFALVAFIIHQNPVPGSERWVQKQGEAHQWVANWPDASRRLADLMIERHGPPDRSTFERVIWWGEGNWKRISVEKSGGTEALVQTVRYVVPREMVGPIGEFGRGVHFDAFSNELIAKGDDEALNILALNIANEIAVGRKTVAEGADFYDKTAALRDAGKSSMYTEGLLFDPMLDKSDEYGPYANRYFLR